MPEPRSAVLRDLVVAAQHVAVELDGRRIVVRADPRSEAYAALRNLHEKMEASVAARVHQPAAGGLFSRIRSFFRGLFGTGSDAGEEASPSAQRRAVVQGPQHFSDPGARMQRGHAREIFLDSHGMRVRWTEDISVQTDETSPAQSSELIDLTFAPDSPVTEQLHRCLRELDRLGYAVPGGDTTVRFPAITDPKLTGQAVASTLSVDKGAGAGAPTSQPKSADIEKPGAAVPGSAIANETTPKEIVGTAGSENTNLATTNIPQERRPSSKDLVTMRLRPELPDSPTRGLVASVETPESAEILVAPELLLRALRVSAALPSTSEQRLTFLQCMKNENGLRIVNVGLGSNGEGQPIAWQDATQWWQTYGKNLATAAEAANQRVAENRSAEMSERTYVCGPSPLGVSATVRSTGAEMEPASPTA